MDISLITDKLLSSYSCTYKAELGVHVKAGADQRRDVEAVEQLEMDVIRADLRKAISVSTILRRSHARSPTHLQVFVGADEDV
jgi:hypothetical protein